MKTSRYQVFLKIVETKSLTRTAAYFGCTQSAVSQLVKALETELGVSLLIRSKNGVRLTAEGEYLLPSMRQIVAGERSVFERALELQNLNAGLIRIGIFTSLSCQWLPPYLKRFRETYPNIGFELLQGDVQEISEWLRNGTVDVGFTTPPNSEEFYFRELLADRMNIVLPPEHPLAGQEEISAQALQGIPFLVPQGLSATRRYVMEQFESLGFTPHALLDLGTAQAVKQGVINGLGVGIVSRRSVRMEEMAQRLVCRPVQGMQMTRTLCVVKRKDRQMTAEEAAWIETVRSLSVSG